MFWSANIDIQENNLEHKDHGVDSVLVSVRQGGKRSCLNGYRIVI